MSPQTNRNFERFRRMIQDVSYPIVFRKKLFTSIEKSQEGLDTWIKW